MERALGDLYLPERHETLEVPSWNAETARAGLEEILAEIRAAEGPDGLWPEQGAEEGEAATRRSLYDGNTGIRWGLTTLARRGYLSLDDDNLDPGSMTTEDMGHYKFMFTDFNVALSNSLLLGPSGVDLFRWKQTGDQSLLDQLDKQIGDNEDHTWMEFLWGAPSTMLTAAHLFKATGEERFADHVRSGARYLEARLERDEHYDCQLWTIPLYGEDTRIMGAGHGFVGNVKAILQVPEVFSGDEFRRWQDLIIDTTTKTAMTAEGFANWPATVGKPRMGRGDPLVQWCHGAPGFVIGLVSLYGEGDETFDALMLAGGEMTWKAGPLAKYPGLCHGTPGNGYAFLKLYEKTGDELWLTRARAFAMMALAQHEAWLMNGEGERHSLWSGSMGLALYLADCLEARTEFPTLDYF